VLDGVDLDVERGETVAIVGPSGAGKSTLLRCMNYLEPFEAGSIEIAGLVLRPDMLRGAHRATLRQVRTKVGMVFQQFHLFPHLTALENVTLAPRVVQGRERALVEQAAHQILSRVGLAERHGAYPHELSGGQQQRVAIARALAAKPDVMLFDEPTSALDPALRTEVIQVIKSLASDGMTILVVTHEPTVAAALATRHWVVDAGKVSIVGDL